MNNIYYLDRNNVSIILKYQFKPWEIKLDFLLENFKHLDNLLGEVYDKKIIICLLRVLLVKCREIINNIMK